MRRAAVLFLFLLLLVAACEKPEPESIQVGTHLISVINPPDWERFDYGEQYQWRKDFERISLQDMGRMGSKFDWALERALEKLGENDRREIASLDTLEVSGRDAMMVETWDLVSHQYPKRYLLVINQGNMLGLYTMQGQFELMEPAFTNLAGSLAFIDSVGVGGDQTE